MRRLLLILVACAALAPGADASQFVGRNAKQVRLRVSAQGAALVTYRVRGRTEQVLAWGAVNARHPRAGTPQVRFRLDWTGGWATFGRKIWRRFPDACRPYDGPAARLARRGVQRTGWDVLGPPGVAPSPAAPRLPAVATPTAIVGAPRVALERIAGPH